jgi:hypothetical protein
MAVTWNWDNTLDFVTLTTITKADLDTMRDNDYWIFGLGDRVKVFSLHLENLTHTGAFDGSTVYDDDKRHVAGFRTEITYGGATQAVETSTFPDSRWSLVQPLAADLPLGTDIGQHLDTVNIYLLVHYKEVSSGVAYFPGPRDAQYLWDGLGTEAPRGIDFSFVNPNETNRPRYNRLTFIGTMAGNTPAATSDEGNYGFDIHIEGWVHNQIWYSAYADPSDRPQQIG